jgi:hypothetical protein
MVLLQKCQQASDDGLIGELDSAEIATSESAMGQCVKKAGLLLGVLESTNWEIFEAIGKLPGERKSTAESIRSSIIEALRCDEHVRALGPALKEAQSRALQLLTEVTPCLASVTPTPSPQRSVQPGRTVVDQGSLDFQSVGTAREKLDELASLVHEGRSVHLTLTWRVEEKK